MTLICYSECAYLYTQTWFFVPPIAFYIAEIFSNKCFFSPFYFRLLSGRPTKGHRSQGNKHKCPLYPQGSGGLRMEVAVAVPSQTCSREHGSRKGRKMDRHPPSNPRAPNKWLLSQLLLSLSHGARGTDGPTHLYPHLGLE
jgi:hypothetical protein